MARKKIILFVKTLIALTFLQSAFIQANPKVTLPPNTGTIAMGELARAEANGYSEQEFFFEGTATAYKNVGALGDDGRFRVEPDTTAPYRMRMVVRAPQDPARFNGLVLVEWFNVSGQVEAGPEFGYLFREMFREGYAYVGVGAQYVGLHGAQGLKASDPERYASLTHPGDSFSYDIFSQAARAIRQPGDIKPLGELTDKVRLLIAAGESQSAGRMVTYVNAIHPIAKVYDAYFIHSRSASGSALAQAGETGGVAATIRLPGVVPIPTDIDVPVFQFQAETDVPRFVPARQADTNKIRTWEMTGTAHYDQYGLSGGGERPLSMNCFGDNAEANVPINDGPQTFLLRAGLRSLRAWMENGKAPASAPPLQIDGNQIARDSKTGNALGGVRTPHIDVPLRTLHGDRGDAGGGRFCFLFGRTDEWNGDSDPYDGKAADPSPTPEPNLRELYSTQANFLNQFQASLRQTIQAGFLLADDSEEILAEVRQQSGRLGSE